MKNAWSARFDPVSEKSPMKDESKILYGNHPKPCRPCTRPAGHGEHGAKDLRLIRREGKA